MIRLLGLGRIVMAAPYAGTGPYRKHVAYSIAAGLTISGILNYKKNTAIALAEESNGEHDRLYNHIFTQIPDILSQQNVPVDSRFRERFKLMGKGMLETNGPMFLKSLGQIDNTPENRKLYVFKFNSFNKRIMFFVPYDELTMIEKVNGVCYLCGQCDPGNRTRRMQIRVKGRCDFEIYSVHENCVRDKKYDINFFEDIYGVIINSERPSEYNRCKTPRPTRD